MQLALGLDCRIQISPVVGARFGDHLDIVFALVGIGLQVGRVRVEHRAINKAGRDRLFDDAVEDRLRHAGIVVATPPVLRQRRGVEHLVRQLQPQEPAVGDIDLDLAHQLALRANPTQVADEQRLEHQGRVQRRTAIVGAIEQRRQIVDEGKVDHTVDLAQQVINWNQLIQRHHLERSLFRGGSLQHDAVNHKPPALARGLSAV